MLTHFVLASLLTSLAGVWASERDFTPPANSRVIREGFAIQPPDGSFTDSVATPARFGPLPDVQHIFLVIRPAADGTLQAFFRNPESNIGPAIGIRAVVADGNSIRLTLKGQADLTGSIEGEALRFHLDRFPGDFIFHRLNAANDQAYYARAGAVRYTYRVPLSAGDGWKTGSLRSVGLDPNPIAALMDNIIDPGTAKIKPYIQSVLIARHGRLVLDEYFYGFNAERAHDVRSAGKSVTTLMLARAIEDGAPFSPQTPISKVFARYEPFANDDARKQSMTLGNLMSMSSGLSCDDNDDNSPGNEDTMQSQSAQPDWYKYTLDLPMLYAPGAHPLYCSAGINLLGAAIHSGTNRWLPAYFNERFAQPMQFKQYGMWLTPPPVSDAYMAGGDYFRPRDFLKFGQLFLTGGTWQGRRIISRRWLGELAAKHSTIEGEGDYGYGWHLLSYTINGRTIRAINAGGNGGQLLYVFPDLDMALMITAGNYGQFRVWSKFSTDLIPRYILSAAVK